MLARRKLMTGLAGLPLAAVLADPRLAALAAEGTEPVSITTKGGESVSGADRPAGHDARSGGAADP